jgi:hypothetical protein
MPTRVPWPLYRFQWSYRLLRHSPGHSIAFGGVSDFAPDDALAVIWPCLLVLLVSSGYHLNHLPKDLPDEARNTS